MSDYDLWSRLRKARLVEVLVLYLGASWGVVEVTDTLEESLELPSWISPLAIILLLIGLIIILATAWVQSHPLTPDRAEADEVPGSWELDLGELKESVTRGRLPHLTWSRAILGGVFAFSLLFGLAGLYVILKDRGRSFVPTEALASAAEPGVAVLPFAAQGEGLEMWREGIVDLLTTNLDGAGGLRAIDSRTVMARWREEVSEGETPDLATALDVARRAEARFAVVGSAVTLAGDVRLVADIYRVSDGEKLDQVRVEGPRDSVLSLVDRMSIETLRVVLPEESRTATPANLAGATTTSIEALRDFLEGERLFRASDFAGAIAAYERAVAVDSTFALALYRLSNAYGWNSSITAPETSEYRARTLRHVDRLPERAALVVDGMMALVEGRGSAVAELRELARRYPDDPDVWMLLGEIQYHVGLDVTLDTGLGEEAFRRAVTLDPGFTPAYIHLVDLAFQRADSAGTAELAAAFHAKAPGTPQDIEIQNAFRIAFGDSAARAAAWAQVAESDWHNATFALRLDHPRFWPERDGLLAHFKNEGGSAYFFFVEQFLRAGRLRTAIATLDDPRHFPMVPEFIAYRALQRGLALPPDVVSRYLTAAAAAEADDPGGDFWIGAAAIQDGRFAAADSIIARLDHQAADLGSSGDAAGERVRAGVAAALRGYALAEQGELEAALPLLDSARLAVTGHEWQPYANRDLRLWTAEALIELGRLDEAERYLLSLQPFREPLPAYHLAKLYVELDEPDKARPYLLFVLDAWEGADPELQPKVEEAQALIEHLMPDSGG